MDIFFSDVPFWTVGDEKDATLAEMTPVIGHADPFPILDRDFHEQKLSQRVLQIISWRHLIVVGLTVAVRLCNEVHAEKRGNIARVITL